MMQPCAFNAVLFPHRSLSRRGFRGLMVLLGAALGLAAVRLSAIGAWPAALFALAQIVLVYGAFHLNYRAGRRFEEVSVTEREVLVRKVAPSGRVTEHRFHPVWARLSVTRVEDEGVTRLALGSHGRWIVIGAFLDPDDRASFAEAFADALAAARHPA